MIKNNNDLSNLKDLVKSSHFTKEQKKDLIKCIKDESMWLPIEVDFDDDFDFSFDDDSNFDFDDIKFNFDDGVI